MPKPTNMNYKAYRASKAQGKVRMQSLPPAVRMASSGEFVVDDNDIATAQTLSTGTDNQLYAIGSTTTAMLYTNVKIWMWLHSLSVKLPLIVTVYKALATDAAVDTTSEQVLERLRSDGRLFYHHWHLVPAMPAASNISVKPFFFEYKNVKLEEDEQLIVAVRTRATATDVFKWIVAKYAATEL